LGRFPPCGRVTPRKWAGPLGFLGVFKWQSGPVLYGGDGCIFKGPRSLLGAVAISTIMSGGRVLVTGASGFVGSAVAKALVEAGYAVRALVRPTSPRAHLDGVDVEFVPGDLRDAESVRQAIAGAAYV